MSENSERAKAFFKSRDQKEIDRLRALLTRCRAELIDDGHAYNGLCPEPGSLDARDPDCPACALIVEIEEETK